MTVNIKIGSKVEVTHGGGTVAHTVTFTGEGDTLHVQSVRGDRICGEFDIHVSSLEKYVDDLGAAAAHLEALQGIVG